MNLLWTSLQIVTSSNANLGVLIGRSVAKGGGHVARNLYSIRRIISSPTLVNNETKGTRQRP